MSEDTLVERLERHVNILGVCDHFEVRSVGPKIGLCLNCEMTGADHLCREAAARLTAQAEEIGRLRNGVGAALRSLDTALASDGAMGCEDIDLLTEARVELTAALKGQP